MGRLRAENDDSYTTIYRFLIIAVQFITLCKAICKIDFAVLSTS
jgi:hypothetical protein